MSDANFSFDTDDGLRCGCCQGLLPHPSHWEECGPCRLAESEFARLSPEPLSQPAEPPTVALGPEDDG